MRKIFIIWVTAFIMSFTILMSFLFYNNLVQLFQEQEAIMMEEYGNLYVKFLTQHILTIDENTKDWAYWDELYNYVATNQIKQIAALQTSITTLNKDAYLIYTSDKTYLIGKQLQKDDIPIDQQFIKYIATFLERSQTGISGIISYNQKFLIIAGYPILHTDGSGPQIGTLFFILILDSANYSQNQQLVVNLSSIESEEDILRPHQHLSISNYVLEKHITATISKTSVYITKIQIYIRNFIILQGGGMLLISLGLIILFYRLIIVRLKGITRLIKQYDASYDDAEYDDIAHITKTIVAIFNKMKSTEYELNRYKNQLEEIIIEKSKTLHILESSIEILPLGITIVDLEGHIIYVNKSDAAIHGYTKEEVLQMTIQEAYYHNDKTQIIDSYNNLDAFRGLRRTAYHYRKDDSIFPVRIISEVVQSEQGHIIGIVMIDEDITSLRHLEEGIVRLKKALDTTHVGITITNNFGQIIYTNPAEVYMHGYSSEEELIGKMSNVYAPNYLQHDDLRANGKHEEFPNWKRETINIKKTGEEFPVEIISNPIYTPDGNFLGRVAICNDITERYQYIKAIQQQNNILHATLEASTDGIFVTDSHQQITHWNANFKTMWHIPKDMSRLSTEQEIINHIAQYTQNSEIYSRVMQEANAVQHYTYDRMPCLDGRIISVYTTQLICNEKFEGRLWSFRDITERIHSEKKLMQSEQRFRDMAELLPQMICETDDEGNICYVNKYGLDMLGYTKDQILIKNIFQIFDHSKQDTITEVLRHTLERGIHIKQESVILRKDNLSIPILVYISPRIVDSIICGIIGLFIDITEQKRNENRLALINEQLREEIINRQKIDEKLLLSEERYRKLFELSPDAIIVHTSENIHMINQAALNLVRASNTQDILNKNIIHFIHPDYQKIITAAIETQPAVNTQRALIEAKIVCLDGTTGWVEVTSSKFLYQDKLASLTILREITARKEIESALINEKNFNKALIDHLPDPLYVEDQSGKYISCNTAMIKFLQLQTTAQFIGKTNREIYLAYNINSQYEFERKILKTHQSIIDNEEQYINPKTQQTHWFLTTRIPFTNAQDEVIGVIGIMHDITTRKLAQIALVEEHNLLITLINTVPDFIYVKDKASKFILANHSLSDMMGAIHSEDLIGKTDFDFYPENIAQQYYNREQLIFTTGQPIINQEEFHDDPTTGEKLCFLATKIPFTDSKDVIRGLICVSRNITEYKKLLDENIQLQNSYKTLAQQTAIFLEKINTNQSNELDKIKRTL
jgi:PAS domain S-box-containing protein